LDIGDQDEIRVNKSWDTCHDSITPQKARFIGAHSTVNPAPVAPLLPREIMVLHTLVTVMQQPLLTEKMPYAMPNSDLCMHMCVPVCVLVWLCVYLRVCVSVWQWDVVLTSMEETASHSKM
jgi:hypothetical protein